MSHRDFTAELASLQQAGAAARDPIGFEHLRLMVQRLAGQPESVQRVLAERVEAGLVRAQMRAQAQAQAQTQAQTTPQTQTPLSQPTAKPQPGPLAALPSHAAWRHGDKAPQNAATVASRTGTGTGTGTTTLTTARAPGPLAQQRELHSVDRFRETWAQVAAEAQVKQALGRAPDNAGPLNSHVLVLRALEVLQALSPEHLRAMLTQFDALLWLEQATQKPTLKPAPKPASKPAAKPPARTRKGTPP